MGTTIEYYEKNAESFDLAFLDSEKWFLGAFNVTLSAVFIVLIVMYVKSLS